MRTTIVIALALGLGAGCASDLWYKKGAGTAALAQDKAACSAETAQLAGAQAREAFEQCMSARDWYHVATGRRRSAPRVRRVASAPARETKPVATLAPASPVAPPAAPVPALAVVEAAPAVAPAAPAPESAASDAALALPSVAAGAEPAPVEDEAPVEEEFLEEELAPEPVDPRSRQFWVKFGAGTNQQLAADQKTCRREIGVPDTETQPSRWGQSEEFDTCMRGRGWGGGSIQATENR